MKMTAEQVLDHARRNRLPCALEPAVAVPATISEHDDSALPGEEIELQGNIANYLRLHELEYIWPNPRKKSPLPIGWPDFSLCYIGVALGLEVKTATGKLSGVQVEMHARLRANGWRVQVVRSIADVQAIFRDIDRNSILTP